MRKRYDKGFIFLEVLISLSIIGTAILGYVLVQTKAAEVSSDNVNRVKASILASDYIQKILANPTAKSTYFNLMQSESTQNQSTNCYGNSCTPEEKAKADVYMMYRYASENKLTMKLDKCAGNTRNCLYIAWGDTLPQIGTDDKSCASYTNVSSVGEVMFYKTNAKCYYSEVLS